MTTKEDIEGRTDEGDAAQATVGSEGGAAPLGSSRRVSRSNEGPVDRSPSKADTQKDSRTDLNEVERN
jgi:hypothetical protein